MRKLLAASMMSAVLGGGVTAGILLATGVVGSSQTRTVYQQSPLDSSRPTADGEAGDALTARDIYKRDAPGVAFIHARALEQTASPFDIFGGRQDTEGTGSGFVIDEEGHVLTNAHVVDNATLVTVTLSGKKTRAARIVGVDQSTDLALLKIDPDGLDLRPLELGDSKSVQVGDPTVAIGNPFGFDRTLTTGVVSALQRRITAPDGYTIENVIQTDAAINPGNSGGPLIDASGRVIGINSQIATGGNGTGSVGIGFAVPIDTAKEVVRQLREHGRVERAWLGMKFVAIGPSLDGLGLPADHGLLVQSVIPNGPAFKAGIQGGDSAVHLADGQTIIVGGDVVTRIDGREMRTPVDVRKVLDARRPGDAVTVELQRVGSKRTVRVTLGNRPAGQTDQ